MGRFCPLSKVIDSNAIIVLRAIPLNSGVGILGFHIRPHPIDAFYRRCWPYTLKCRGEVACRYTIRSVNNPGGRRSSCSRFVCPLHRNQLQVLRGRLSRGKPGENGPTLSPSCRLKPGNELPPGVGKHGRGVSLTRPGARVGTRVGTHEGTAEEIRIEESVTPKGEYLDGKGDRCGDLGTGPLNEDHGTARETIGAVDLGDGDDGQNTLQPESSVRSRPSELFDSLELSAS